MKVLIAEDDRVSQRLLEWLIKKWGYDPIVVSNGQDALELMMRSDAPQLVLLDWQMPGLDGPEVCRLIFARETTTPPYIIFLTADERSAAIVQALELGASDFVCKPFNRDELHARLRVGERTITLQEKLWAAEQQMAELAMYDPLMGIYNRRAILDILEKEVNRATRDEQVVSVAIADLDHFKQINDTHGHQTGDQVLVAFSRLVRDVLRGTDTVGRWGGEEFLIIAPSKTSEHFPGGMNPLFERIRKRVEASAAASAGLENSVTVSIGMTVADGRDDLDVVIRMADEALYSAKRAGRNRVCANLHDNHQLCSPKPSAVSQK